MSSSSPEKTGCFPVLFWAIVGDGLALLNKEEEGGRKVQEGGGRWKEENKEEKKGGVFLFLKRCCIFVRRGVLCTSRNALGTEARTPPEAHMIHHKKTTKAVKQ
jgi:hypothetical protein